MTKPKYVNKFSPEQRKWIDALKSSKYKKAKGSLMTLTKKNEPMGYCCLGVYCFISGQKWKVPNNVWESEALFGPKKQDSILNKAQTKKLKLRSTMGELKFKFKQYSSLVDINDCSDWSLKRIGEWIEKNPDLVFTNFNEGPNI